MSFIKKRRPWDSQPQEVVWLNPDFPAIAGFIAGAGGTRNIALYPAEPSGASTGSNTYPSPGAGGIGVYSAGSANDGVKLHSIGNATNTVWEYPSARVSVAVFLRRIGNTGGNSPIFANLDPSASPFTAWGIVDASGTGTPQFQTSGGGAYTGLLSSAAFGDNEDVVIVGTYDGATMRIYRNGVLTGSTAKSGAIVYPNSAGRGPTVGNFWGGYVGRSFNGFIYGGLLSDIAWTDAEVRRISTLSGFWSAFEPQRIWIPVSAGGGTTITATLGTATASGHQATVNVNRTIAASLGTATASGFQATVQNSTDTTISATLGTATASGFAANVDANRTIAAGLGTATASGHQATVSNTNDTVINAGVGTAAASGHAASLDINRTIAAALGTAQAVGYAATVRNGDAETARRHAGYRREKVRKGYIIKGKRYWLTEDELMAMVAQELSAISRKDVKQITKTKPKVISKQVWDAIRPLERLEALTPIEQDDDEDEVLMMFM